MLYILEDPIKVAKNFLKKIFLLNYIFAKRKYLRCSYNPAKSNISYHYYYRGACLVMIIFWLLEISILK